MRTGVLLRLTGLAARIIINSVPSASPGGYRGVAKFGIAPGLGPGDRAFEPHYSDQNPSEIVDFRGIFLFFVYCDAGFEGFT